MAQPTPPEQPFTPIRSEKRWLPITLAALGGAAVAAVAAATITAGMVRSTSVGLPVPVPAGGSTATPQNVPPPPGSAMPPLAPQQADAATCTMYDRAEDLIREANQVAAPSPGAATDPGGTATRSQPSDLYRQAATRITATTISPGTTPALAQMTSALSSSLSALATFTESSDTNLQEIRAAVDANDHAVAVLCDRFAAGR